MVQMCSLKTSVDKQQERELTNTQSVKNSCGKRKVWHCPGALFKSWNWPDQSSWKWNFCWEFLLKTKQCYAWYLEMDWFGWTNLVNNGIVYWNGQVWPVTSDYKSRGGGGYSYSYITYKGMCRPTGSWLWSPWFRTGYPFQRWSTCARLTVGVTFCDSTFRWIFSCQIMEKTYA